MVTVTKTNETWNRVCVQCPICGELINRIKGHWDYHMKTSHNVAEDELSVPIYGGNFTGLIDRENSRVKYGYECYGCGSYFASKDDLISHLQTGKIVTEDQEFYITTEDDYRLIQE